MLTRDVMVQTALVVTKSVGATQELISHVAQINVL